MRVVLATKNPDKRREMRRLVESLLPGLEIVEGLDWADVPETGETLEENALLKARAVAASTGLPALADDTGLEVTALDGAPGVATARFAGPKATYAENRSALLAALEGVEDRSARFRSVVALVEGGTERVASGSLEGSITTEEAGSGGFGYDSVFAVGESTLADLSEGEKNRISHRARAVAALASMLGD